VFENSVLRRIIGPKRDEVTAGWRKLHNEEFHHLCPSSSIIRLILVGKPKGKRPLHRPRCRWVDIKTDLKERGWDGLD
jgi:hypothetical protein